MRLSKILALLLVVMLCLCGCKGNDPVTSSGKGSNTEDANKGSGNSLNNDSALESNESNIAYDVTIGSIYDTFLSPDGEEVDEDFFVESGTSISTLKTDWEGVYKMSGSSDEQAKEYRSRILNTKNTEEYYTWSGTTYYVSPNGNDDNDGKSPKTAVKTMNASIFTMDILKPGDAVLFERGGLWRLRYSLSTVEGVVYGSYGIGEKPTFYGSTYNYADESFWDASKRQNVWKVSISDYDIGLVVFNHGELVGNKKNSGLTALGKNGDYYYNQKEDTLYLYFDKGNPGKYFKDIELGLRIAGISVSVVDDVIIDNFKLKYFGAFGISLGGANNSTITNCEIGFIGGAMQNETVRYGNGIQHWNGGDGHIVENCWVYQVYDTGLTWQGNEYWKPGYTIRKDYNDFIYRNNLIEYCAMSFEFWHDTTESTHISGGEINGFICEKNISRFAGYGFGQQRPDPMGTHIRVGKRCFPKAINSRISDNIFDISSKYIVDWRFNKNDNNGIWDISNNIYYHGKNAKNEAMWFGNINIVANNQNELDYAISIFEKKPLNVVWVD